MRDIAAIIAWSLFWVVVIFGVLALIWEWHLIGPALGLRSARSNSPTRRGSTSAGGKTHEPPALG